MNWIVGVLDMGTLSELDKLILEIRENGNLPRYSDLSEVRRKVIEKQDLQ